MLLERLHTRGFIHGHVLSLVAATPQHRDDPSAENVTSSHHAHPNREPRSWIPHYLWWARGSNAAGGSAVAGSRIGSPQPWSWCASYQSRSPGRRSSAHCCCESSLDLAALRRQRSRRRSARSRHPAADEQLRAAVERGQDADFRGTHAFLPRGPFGPSPRRCSSPPTPSRRTSPRCCTSCRPTPASNWRPSPPGAGCPSAVAGAALAPGARVVSSPRWRPQGRPSSCESPAWITHLEEGTTTDGRQTGPWIGVVLPVDQDRRLRSRAGPRTTPSISQAPRPRWPEARTSADGGASDGFDSIR